MKDKLDKITRTYNEIPEKNFDSETSKLMNLNKPSPLILKLEHKGNSIIKKSISSEQIQNKQENSGNRTSFTSVCKPMMLLGEINSSDIKRSNKIHHSSYSMEDKKVTPEQYKKGLIMRKALQQLGILKPRPHQYKKINENVVKNNRNVKVGRQKRTSVSYNEKSKTFYISNKNYGI